MLRWRLMAAVALIVPLVSMLWLDGHYNWGVPGIWLIPLGLLMVTSSCSEIVMLSTDQKWTPVVTRTVLAGLLAAGLMLVPIVYRPEDCPLGNWGWTVGGLFAALALLLLMQMRELGQPESDRALPLMGFAIAYVIVPLSFVLQLRLLHLDAWGIAAVTSVAAIVKCSDAGAYFVGRLVGKRPLAPRLSPKKTIEGAGGGIAVAALVAIGLHLHVLPWLFDVPPASPHLMSLAGLALYGLILAVAGIFGDLAVSYLKRTYHQKDSGSWLPGLGGSLDILDSVLWAAPVAYLCWAAKLIGP